MASEAFRLGCGEGQEILVGASCVSVRAVCKRIGPAVPEECVGVQPELERCAVARKVRDGELLTEDVERPGADGFRAVA